MRAEHEVVVIGAGPVGMMVAAELALAGVDVALVERRADQSLIGSRAGGLHARALELLDQRGVVDRFLAEGQTAQAAMFAGRVLDMSDFPTRHPYALGLWQNRIEAILAAWVAELPVTWYRSREFVALTQDADGVAVEIRPVAGGEGELLRAGYLIGADGGRSAVRRAVGIDFPGQAATMSSLIAEVQITEAPAEGIKHDASGIHGMTPLEDGVTMRIITTEPTLGPLDSEPTLADLAANLRTVYGTDFGVHSPTWISRFSDTTRHAERYRDGRVLLVGDALHIHHPNGGQGMTLGFQDAVNLGWKLAQVVHGTSDPALLDTYESERRPATASALAHTMAMSVVMRPDPRSEALRDVFGELAGADAVRRIVAGRLSGLDVRYPMTDAEDDAHPLVGRRMPDLDLIVDGEATTVFTLLHAARPLLLDLGTGLTMVEAVPERVRQVAARTDGPWALPVIGDVLPVSAALVRPDGHVAWVRAGDSADSSGLSPALARWLA